MPAQRIIHASDFHHWNPSANFDARLDKAFDYYRANVPGFDGQLQAQLDKGVWLMENTATNPLLDPKITSGSSDDLRGQDLTMEYTGNVNGATETHPTVALNLDTAMIVTDHYGHITGMESAASAAAHEIVSHGSQGEANDLLLGVVEPGYNTFNERVAIGIDDLMNKLSGEPSRGNHGGTEVSTLDVTLHTVTNQDGTMQLARVGSDGQMEYGPVIDFNSPGWQDIQKAYDELDILNGHAAAHDKNGIETVWGNDTPGLSVTTEAGDPTGDPTGNDPGRDASGQPWDSGEPSGDNDGGIDYNNSNPGADGSGPGGGRNRDWHEDDSAPSPGVLTDTQGDLTGGSAWLEHWNGGPHTEGATIAHLVGVPHVDARIFT